MSQKIPQRKAPQKKKSRWRNRQEVFVGGADDQKVPIR